MSEENQLPKSWRIARIGDICIFNPKHPQKLDPALEVSFVPMAAVDEVTGTIQRPEIRLLEEVKKGFTQFADGDVVWAKITPCMENGKSAVAANLKNGIGFGTTEFHVLRSRGEIEPQYLHKYMRQSSYLKAARATMQSGVGQARVPKEFILETEIPLPHPDEQRKLLVALNNLQARSSKAREALESVTPLTEKFRQSVLAAAFRGDLTKDWRVKNKGKIEPASELLKRNKIERRKKWEEEQLKRFEAAGKAPKEDAWKGKYKEPENVDTEGLPALPEGWVWGTLAELGEWFGGGTPSKSSALFWKNGSIPWVSPKDMKVRTISETEDYITIDAVKGSATTLLPKNSILMVVRSGILSHSFPLAIASVPVTLNQDMKGIVVSEGMLPTYLLLGLEAYAQRILLSCRKSGTTVSSVEFDLLKRFCIPIAPLQEQEYIGSILGNFINTIECTRQMVVDRLEKLSHLDQSILAKAFRGELLPQDSNDEPTPALLDRTGKDLE